MQLKNKSLSQPFYASTKYHDSFEEFRNSRIGNVQIAEIPSRIKETHLKIWGGINVNMDYLTIPLEHSIEAAAILYILRPYVNAQKGGLQEKADMHHALIRLKRIWTRLEEALEGWAKTEIGAYANAADGLSCLEQARFLPVLWRFFRAMQEYGEQLNLFEEAEEFVTACLKLTQKVEIWLDTQNAWWFLLAVGFKKIRSYSVNEALGWLW